MQLNKKALCQCVLDKIWKVLRNRKAEAAEWVSIDSRLLITGFYGSANVLYYSRTSVIQQKLWTSQNTLDLDMYGYVQALYKVLDQRLLVE